MLVSSPEKAYPFWLKERGVVLLGTLQSIVVPLSFIIQLKLLMILCLSCSARQ